MYAMVKASSSKKKGFAIAKRLSSDKKPVSNR